MATNEETQVPREDVMRALAEVRQRVSHLEEENEAKQDRIDDLEAENESLRNEIDEVQTHSAKERAGLNRRLHQLEEMASEVRSLPEELDEERQARGRQDAKLRRRMSALAEKAGVELTDADLLGDDKIKRVITHGVDDVEENPRATARRAETLLTRLPSWGQMVSDKNGARVTITTPEARERMEDRLGETLSSMQVKRVFRKIVEWAGDSPRHAAFDTGRDVNRLVVSLEEVDTDR